MPLEDTFDDEPTFDIDPLRWLSIALLRVHRRPGLAFRYFVLLP